MEPSPFSHRMLHVCLEHAADRGVPAQERVLAARLGALLLSAAPAGEGDPSRAVAAIVGSLGSPRVTSPLLRGLCRSAGAHRELGPVLERIGRAALRAGDWDTLGVVESLLSARPEGAAGIPVDWQRALVDSMLPGLPSDSTRLRRLIRRIVQAGEVPDWLRARVETFPAQFCALDLGPFCMAALQRAAPSVQMWLQLAATSRWCAERLSWNPGDFGGALPAAVETLEQALGQCARGAVSVVLARWLVELTGEGG